MAGISATVTAADPNSYATLAQSTPIFDLGEPMLVQPGEVSIELGETVYTLRDTIRIDVKNGLSDPVYATDRKTDCTILLLLRWTGKLWEGLSGCLIEGRVLTVAIGPGRGRLVDIDLTSGNMKLAAGRPSPRLGPGWYLLKLSFQLVPAGPGDLFSVYSQPFLLVVR